MGKPTRRGIPSIVSADARIDGDVVSVGEVHVLGTITGSLKANKLILGAGGVITGTVETDIAEINGRLTGRLASAHVVLGSHARVAADIIYVSMRVDPGAVFEGYSRRVHSIAAPAAMVQTLPADAPTAGAIGADLPNRLDLATLPD